MLHELHAAPDMNQMKYRILRPPAALPAAPYALLAHGNEIGLQGPE